MKKKLVILLSLAMVLTFARAACGGGSESGDGNGDAEVEEPAENTEDAEGEEPAENTDGNIDVAAYGYTGNDPVEAACYKYMAETIGKEFEAADASIPTVNIVYRDDSGDNEVLVYGDFWVENYNIEGDTLKCVSGGNFCGCMHVSKADNTVTAFDQVADGGEFEPTAKEIFGEHFDDFMKVNSDSDARNALRKKTVSDYVKQYGLDVKYYQDEGWDPVELDK